MTDSVVVPEGTTLIDVYLKNPNGHPMTNTRFIIKPSRAGYVDQYAGIVEDKEELYTTNSDGYIQLHLWPLPYPYILTYSYDDESYPGSFIFYVPATTETVRLQDLIVAKPGTTSGFGDDVLAEITAIKAAVTVLANQTKANSDAAKAFKDTAVLAAQSAELSAASTAEDRTQVGLTLQAVQQTLASISEAIIKIQAIQLQNKLMLGTYTIWVDQSGKLRIFNGTPTSDTAGTVVGDQTA